MTTPSFKKPTQLVRDFAALDPELRGKVIDAAQHAIKVREGRARPLTRRDRGGRVYLKEYFPCCAGIREPSRGYPRSYLSHARTVTHVAHQLDMQEYEKAMRTVIRLLDAGEDLEEVIGRCHSLATREAIKILIKMAHST
jgi:hypothetical protein